MNEYVIKKLKEGRLNANLKQSDVASKIGIKGNTLSNYENGVSEPDIDTFCALCEIYNLDPADVLGEAYGLSITGSDFHIKPSEIEQVKKYRNLDNYGKELVDFILQKEFDRCTTATNFSGNSVEKRLINYYYRLASAGTGQIVFDMPPTKRIEIPCTPENRRVDYAIGVNGSSMEPLYFDDDILLVEMTDSLQLGEIGIFFVDGESYVKKLGEHELISLNKNYPNKPLSESAKCLGRVVGKL